MSIHCVNQYWFILKYVLTNCDFIIGEIMNTYYVHTKSTAGMLGKFKLSTPPVLKRTSAIADNTAQNRIYIILITRVREHTTSSQT